MGICAMVKDLSANKHDTAPYSPLSSLKHMARSTLWVLFLYYLWYDFGREKRWIILSKAFLMLLVWT